MRDQIKGYKILRQIGTGGFGEVYVAKQDVINREVAIKVILPVHANEEDFIQRFQQEAELVARLEHPHIVPLYDYWRDPQGAYLVMRYIKGGNLADYLITDGPMDMTTAARLLEQIAGALYVAHRNKVVHQDIKPANILLDDDGNAYLTDFGIARDIESNINLAEDASNTMHGSPKYISPEHLQRKEITHRSDIYSLGLLMYELLTGSPPFVHDEMLKLLQMHVRTDLPPLQNHQPNLPAELNQPLYQATVKNPLSRYDNVLQFARDFQAVVSNQMGAKTSPIALPIDWEVEDTGIIDTVNPYKGLQAFQEADAKNFYGRTVLVDSLKERMAADGVEGRFLAVVGPSGSGKSSVVRAGLLPAIRKNDIPNLPMQYITTMTPSADPMRSLEGAILKIARRATVSMMETLSQDHYDLHEVLQDALADDGEMLLVIDQFEEVFTLTTDEAKRRSFLNLVHHALMRDDSRMRLIITLRADFLDRPLNYDGWGELLRARTELVPPMNSTDLREAIEKPAINNGLIFESGLVGIIIADVNEQVGALPLLQYTLSELYEQRHGIELRIAAYQTMGGIKGALAKRAEEIYSTLSPMAQDIARLVFTRLVRVGSNQNNTRRRVLLGELYSLERDSNLIQETLDKFGKYRLLTFDNDINSRLPTVEIAHEALISSWELLNSWITDNLDALRLQARLSAQARQWHEDGQDSSFLARGAQLNQYATLDDNDAIALTKREQEYLNASMDAQAIANNRARQRRQLFTALTALIFVFGIAAVILAIFANSQRIEAENSRDAEAEALALESTARAEADQNLQLSRARELAASSLLFAETAPDTAMLLALESIAVENTFEGRNALLTDLLTQGRLVGYLNGHDDFVRTIAVSSDGELLISGSRDGEVIFWDAITRTPLFERRVQSGRINTVGFNSDATQAISAGEDGRVIIWDTATGDVLEELTFGTTEVRAASFSPDDSVFAAANSAGEIAIWSSDDFSLIDSFIGHEGAVIYELQFSPDGNFIATGADDNNIYIWNAATFELERIITGHSNWVFALVFSPDSQFLASTGADNSVRLWRVEDGSNEWAFAGHDGDVFGLTFSDDGAFIISGDSEGRLIYWSVTGELVQILDTIGQFEVRSIVDNGNALYVAGDQQAIVASNIGARPRFGTGLATQVEDVLTTAIHPTDGRIAYGGGTETDFNVYILHPDAEEAQALTVHTGTVTDLAWSNEYLVSVGLDNRAVIWQDGLALGVIPLDDGIFSAAIHGNTLALGTNRGRIELWDITGEEDDWSQIAVLSEHQNRVSALVFSPDGSRLISGSRDETIIIWDVASQSIIGNPLTEHVDGIEALAMSPNGDIFASGSRDTNIILWNAETGDALGLPLTQHENWVNDLAFSADGEMLVSVSGDRSIILWGVAEQRAIGLAFTGGHSDWINSVSYSSDNDYIVTSGRDGNVIRWETALHTWQQRACQMINRDLTDSEIRDYFSDFPASSDVCATIEAGTP